MSLKKKRIAVVGATGVVGREMLAALQAHDFPAEFIVALASSRSDGVELDYADEVLTVEKASAESFRGVHLTLMATPQDVSLSLAPMAQAQGSWVVDCSRAFQSSPRVPLALPGVNDAILTQDFEGLIVRVPSATATGLMLSLEPLRKHWGVSAANYSALLSASHYGQRGVSVLESQTADLLGGKEPEAELTPHRMAFNLIPQVGPFGGSRCREEENVREDIQSLNAPERNFPEMRGTTVSVPTFYGTTLMIQVELKEKATVEQVRSALAKTPGVKVLDSSEEGVYPMPMLVTADPTLHIGRIRAGTGNEMHLVACFDNVGFGAAAQALHIGQKLLARV